MGGACGPYGGTRVSYRVLVGKPEGKGQLGMPGRRWEYDIKMGLKEIGLESVDWIALSQDRGNRRAVVKTVINVGDP
jgi:hypothetical protein